MSDDATESDPVADILADWQERRNRGERVTVDDLAREHPDLAGVLRDRVAALGALVSELTSGTPAPSRERLAPVRIDRYVRFRPAGEGGMGIVYWALDTDLNREVAFKVIRPDAGARRDAAAPTEPLHLTPPGRGTPASSAFETLKRRFLQEAWVTAGLEHPGIVPVYELGQTPEGVPYYTMRFVRGSRTLAGAIEAVKGRGLEERLALLEPFLKVCDTIRYAHTKDVIHRDLKPENVALGEFGEAVVLDWGLAKLSGKEDRTGEAWQAKVREMREASDLRTLASALGTPGYMSPEAALGRMDEVDARSDVYSLGAILYQILVGRLPFTFESYGDLVRQLMAGSPPDPSSIDPSVPPELSRICLQALAKNRDARQASIGVLAADLRAWLTRREADRVAETLVREARAAVEGSRDLAAADRLRALDRAGAALARLREVRPSDGEGAALAVEIDELRRRGVEEREAAARSRTFRRAAAAALVVAAVAGTGVAVVIERKRREAEDARAATAEALGAEARAREEAEAEGRRARAAGLAQASSLQVATNPMAALLLARDSVDLHASRGGTDALRAALAASRERLRATAPGGMRSASFVRETGAFAIGTDSGSVRVWGPDGRDALAAPDGGSPVTALHLAPDGQRFAAGRADGSVEIRGTDGNLVTSVPAAFTRVGAVRLLPGGDRVVVLHGDVRTADASLRRVRIVGRDGRELAAAGSADAPAVGFGVTPDGTRVLAACRDGTCVVWDRDGRETARFRVADGPVAFARISPDGTHVAALLADAGVRVVRTDGTPVASVPSAGPNSGTDVQWSGDGRRVVVNDWTAVRSWNLDGTPVGTIVPRDAGRSVSNVVRGLAVSADGSRIATATDDRVLRVWTAEGREVAAIRGLASQVRWLVFAADGTRLVSFGPGDGLTVWDSAGGEHAAFAAHGGSVPSARFTADGARIVTASADGTARVWDRDGACVAVLRADGSPLADAIPLADGRTVTADASGVVRVWDAAGAVSRPVAAPGPRIWNLAAAPDGRRIVAGCADGTVRLRDPDGTFAADLPCGARPVGGVAFSPDGRLLAAGGLDYVTRLFDARTGELRASVPGGHTGFVAFSPGGDRLVTASAVHEARVWTPDGKEGAVLSGHRLWIVAAGFSPDGSRIVTASLDGTARVWDLDGRCVAVLRGHDGGVTSASFSPDGATVVTSSDDGTARLWDADGTPRAVLPGHSSRLLEARFSPDGRLVLSASEDGTARTWFVREEDVRAAAGTRATRGYTADETTALGGLLGPDAAPRVAAAALVRDRLAAEVDVEAAVASVERDASIAPEVRRQAAEVLRARGDDPWDLNAAAWTLAGGPGADPAAARRAVRWATKAARLVPDDAEIANTLGVAQMRAGDAAAAVETLERARRLRGPNVRGAACDDAFRAAALAALGRVADAETALAGARRTAEGSADAPDAVRAAIDEAGRALDAARRRAGGGR